MRAPAIAALAVALSCSISLQSAAVAQAHDASARAIAIFNDVCVSTRAARIDILVRLTADGWSPSSYGSLPTTDNSRRAPDVVNLVGAEPEDTQVFTRILAGKPTFVHVFARVREDGRRIARAPTCNVMIAGVTRREFANALFADPAARASFMRLPIVQHSMNGGVFSAMSSDISPTHSTAIFGAFSMLSYEGPEEDDA